MRKREIDSLEKTTVTSLKRILPRYGVGPLYVTFEPIKRLNTFTVGC